MKRLIKSIFIFSITMAIIAMPAAAFGAEKTAGKCLAGGKTATCSEVATSIINSLTADKTQQLSDTFKDSFTMDKLIDKLRNNCNNTGNNSNDNACNITPQAEKGNSGSCVDNWICNINNGNNTSGKGSCVDNWTCKGSDIGSCVDNWICIDNGNSNSNSNSDSDNCKDNGTCNDNNGNNSDNDNKNDNDNDDGNASLGSYEQQVVNLVNEQRAANGLSRLKVNSALSKVAEAKAVDMRDNNYFSHTSPTYGSPFEMMSTFGINYRTAGENIAKGQKTPNAVMNAWMNSSGHKANILSSSYTEIGVGYVTDSNGTTYWVQMFITP